jgi:hypothetical protein
MLIEICQDVSFFLGFDYLPATFFFLFTPLVAQNLFFPSRGTT